MLLGGFLGLRTGELCGLQRQEVDLVHRVLRVRRQAQEISGHRIVGEPKSEAGIRRVPLPNALVPFLEAHLAAYSARKPDITLKELMAILGHASPVAALRYQHATEERGRALADYMDSIIAGRNAP